MLLPGARVRFNISDRGRIGLPILSGLAMGVWNVLEHLTELVEAMVLSPNAVWALAAGSIGYGYKSFYGYLHMRQRYHLALTRSLYFQNLDSNAGVLTRLIDEGESQESMAALLGYFCLWRYAGPEGWTADELDTAMDLYLDRNADLTVQCESGAALRRLRSLGLVAGSGDRARALAPEQAIAAVHAARERHFAIDPIDGPAHPGELLRVDAGVAHGRLPGMH
jgi:hypothetical protein